MEHFSLKDIKSYLKTFGADTSKYEKTTLAAYSTDYDDAYNILKELYVNPFVKTVSRPFYSSTKIVKGDRGVYTATATIWHLRLTVLQKIKNFFRR